MNETFPFKVIFCDRGVELTRAMAKWVNQPVHELLREHVTIHEGDFGEAILSFKPDTIITPGNSFGWMDDGVDKVCVDILQSPTKHMPAPFQTRRMWTGSVEGVLLASIQLLGEIPVGASFPILVSIPGREMNATLIYAPTMRTPGTYLRGTLAAYLATRSAFRDIKRSQAHPERITILLPGMGTGAGGMDPEVAAIQMCQGMLAGTGLLKIPPSADGVPRWWSAKCIEDWMRGARGRVHA